MAFPNLVTHTDKATTCAKDWHVTVDVPPQMVVTCCGDCKQDSCISI
jgi:hypothetical protein